jgi:hypothetical protein
MTDIIYKENPPTNAGLCLALLDVYRNENADAVSRKMVVDHFMKLSEFADAAPANVD